jgi:hypothetical protein
MGPEFWHEPISFSQRQAPLLDKGNALRPWQMPHCGIVQPHCRPDNVVFYLNHYAFVGRRIEAVDGLGRKLAAIHIFDKDRLDGRIYEGPDQVSATISIAFVMQDEKGRHAVSIASGHCGESDNQSTVSLTVRQQRDEYSRFCYRIRSQLPREPESSLLRLLTIQGIEGEKYLANLPPQRCLVSAEAIKCEVGQIGKT